MILLRHLTCLLATTVLCFPLAWSAPGDTNIENDDLWADDGTAIDPSALADSDDDAALYADLDEPNVQLMLMDELIKVTLDKVFVDEIKHRKSLDITLGNKEYKTLHLRYQVTWLNRKGQKLQTAASWLPLDLNPNGNALIKITAPDPSGVDVIIYIDR